MSILIQQDHSEAKSIFFPVDQDANFLDYRVQSVPGSGSFNSTFKIPDDFKTLTKLVFQLHMTSTINDVDIDLFTDYAQDGEAGDANSESDTTSVYSFNAAIFQELDISGVFSSIAAGHVCGIEVDHNSIGATGHYFGVILEYTI